MRTLDVRRAGNSVFVIGIIPYGAGNELVHQTGIAHFIEHLCFKGTKTLSASQITSSIETIGGDLNAFTDYDITAFYAYVGSEHKARAEHVIRSLITCPTFPKAEIDKERQVILQELKMYKDSPRYMVQDLFQKAIFPPKTRFGLPIIGTQQNINSLTRSEIIETFHRAYSSAELLRIGPDCRKKPSKLLSNDGLEMISKEFVPTTKLYSSSTDQAHVVVGGYTLINEDITDVFFKLGCLSAVYNDMSGRLFKNIREKYGIAYSISWDWEVYANRILQWQVTIGLDKREIKEARKLIIDELSRPLTAVELDNAYLKLIGDYSLKRDNPYEFGKLIVYASVKGVALDSILELAKFKQYLNYSLPTVNKLIASIRFERNTLIGIV